MARRRATRRLAILLDSRWRALVRGDRRATVARLVGLCVELGAARFGGPLTAAERRMLATASPVAMDAASIVGAIRNGADPLGDLLLAVRSPQYRRRLGAVYTPTPIVDRMVTWLLAQAPVRVVDPGCGSGRFAAAVARRRPHMDIVAVDVDPLATLVCRANLATLGASHARVHHADFTQLRLPQTDGRTGFVGNPPYVRHHALTEAQKAWAAATAARLHLPWSGLAGLHVHFLVATLMHGAPGDVGCYITSSEWLDVRYGAALREALLHSMGGASLFLLDRTRAAFPDAMTTAVITCFELGGPRAPIRFRHLRRVEEFGTPTTGSGHPVARDRLRQAHHWTPFFTRHRRRPAGTTTVSLGRIVQVSRGVATGCNAFFVLRKEAAAALGLTAYVVPVLTRARDVLSADGTIRARDLPYVLLAPPRDVDLAAREHRPLREYLTQGERRRVHEAYLCRHRTPWWYVGARRPPIVATYMTRQAPAFALNPDGCAILNVLHGLYPRQAMEPDDLRRLVGYLMQHRQTFRGNGRTYQGGLEKFEPGEMEALQVPAPDELRRTMS
jgi:adenine-specific DNA-methyltransferase